MTGKEAGDPIAVHKLNPAFSLGDKEDYSVGVAVHGAGRLIGVIARKKALRQESLLLHKIRPASVVDHVRFPLHWLL